MAASAILTLKVGYGFADELKRAWFLVRMVLDKPQDADVLLRNYMVDMVDKRRFGCLVVVVGDMNDGVLKRIANAFFFLERFINGEVRKEVVLVVMEGLGCFEEIRGYL